MQLFGLALGFILCSIPALNGRSVEFLNFDPIVFRDDPWNECVADKILENGCIEWDVPGQRGKCVRLNQLISSGTFVQYKCDENYHNFGAGENFCLRNQWKYDMPTCERYCLLKYAVPEGEMEGTFCTRGATEIPCTDRLPLGTHLITVNEHKELVKKVCSPSAQWNMVSNFI